MTDRETREAIEHRDVLLALRAVLTTPSGMTVFKYLFKNLEVGELPPVGMNGEILMDKLGFLRAGSSIFKLVSEASTATAANLLAEVERERHAELYENHASNGSS